MDHDCVVDTARGERLCLGTCAFKYNGDTVVSTTIVHEIAGNGDNAYDILYRYATATAGKSAIARFSGAVLHGIIEEAVMLKAKNSNYDPPGDTKRVFTEGLTLWIKKNAEFAKSIIGKVAEHIIQFAERQTGRGRINLVFYAEAPVVVSVNDKGESWPRFADIVVASKATKKTLLIIDLFFSESTSDMQALCRAKLRGLRYIRSKPVRDTFNLTGIKVAALLWRKPDLYHMASMVMSAPRPMPKRLTDSTFVVMGTRVSAPSPDAVEASRGLAKAFLKKMRTHTVKEMLVRLKTPAIRMLGPSWFTYTSVIARITEAKRSTITILTPTSERVRLLSDALYGGRWIAAAIEELDSGVFKSTDFTPVFIGKTLDKHNTEEKKADRHE